jgi:hypothetical protein
MEKWPGLVVVPVRGGHVSIRKMPQRTALQANSSFTSPAVGCVWNTTEHGVEICDMSVVARIDCRDPGT